MKPRSKTGFTLVELLVVIGIIALLISILLPALNKARAAGQAAKCLSQLHEFHQGTKLWMYDNPKSKAFPGSGWRAKLVRYLKNSKIYLCPSDDFPFSSGVDSVLIDIMQTDYDMALEEGPMVHKVDQGPNTYTLYFDDAPDPSQGDHDYNDLVLKVETKPDGTIVITVVSKNAGYSYNLIDAKTRQILIANLGQSGQSYTIQGGLASYAFNFESDLIYGINSKVLALDYYKGVANPDADDWNAQRIASRYPRFARHMNEVNVLWTDGSASRTPLKTIWPNPVNARKYWHKN